MKLKQINLLPTEFVLDVWIEKDLDKLAKQFHKYYGASEEYYSNNLSPYQVSTANTTTKSLSKGHTKIIMNLKQIDGRIVTHECMHVLWHLHNITGLEMNYDSQEWQAYMIDYLYHNIMDTSNYKKIV